MHRSIKTLVKTFTFAGVCAASLFSVGASYAQDQVTLKMWALVNENYPEFIDMAEKAFQKTHPNVNIELETTPNEAYKTAIQVALVGSEPPDVFFNWAGEDSARLARDGLALDITDLGDMDGGFKSLISKSWQKTFEVNGRLYGVPIEAVSKYFYYNKSFFAEHELDPPKTFQGVLDMCKKIRGIDPSIVPLPIGNSERWHVIHYITILNERVMGMDATQADYDLTAPADALFTDPGYVEAWNKLLALQDANCFQDAPNATSPEVAWSMFSAEISPMILCGTWCMSTFDSEGFTDYALFRFPKIEGGKSDGSTNMVIPQGMQVSAKTKHPKEAVEWLSFLVTPEMGKLYAKMRGAIPSNAELVPEIEDASDQFKWVAKDIASLSASYNVLDVSLEASVADAYLDMGVEILNRTKTPEEAMQVIHDAAVKAKAKLGK